MVTQGLSQRRLRSEIKFIDRDEAPTVIDEREGGEGVGNGIQWAVHEIDG